MLKDKRLTYISLFSSAGVGCYGFNMEDFQCIATNELLRRRIEVQKANRICKFDSGYIVGDISSIEVKEKVYYEIKKWEQLGNDKVDVVIATPPCQGISVINHKKNDKEINRNSLVVESVEIINRIRPRIFIFENVMAFQKTLCYTPEGYIKPIGEFIRSILGDNYIITGRVLNFMNYGSNSSRTRTLMIGVEKTYRNNIVPYDLFHDYQPEKSLRDVISGYPYLEWGEICQSDFYHAFRTYDNKMRSWIHDLQEGESAFDNTEITKIPHQIKNGEVVINVKKNRDKYKRQCWDKFIQCVHTRNDQLAAQNTVHPEQDRVFSIRELMSMMSVPIEFKWIDMNLIELNSLTESEKRAIYKENELNIRQCLGEAVPTEIFRQIARKISNALLIKRYEPININRLINEYGLEIRENLLSFLEKNPVGLDITSLMRIAELCNEKREENAAYYTNKFIVNEIVDRLPDFSKNEIRIVEPSVGVGSFIPFLFKRYDNIHKVILDVVDIDKESIEALQIILKKVNIPSNFIINYICEDFLTLTNPYQYDLAIGNPPFSKIKDNYKLYSTILKKNINKHTKNLSEMFLEKCINNSDYIALVLNKTILSNDEFSETRDWIKSKKINVIIDFGRYGFTGLSIETICLIIAPNQKPKNTLIFNLKYNKLFIQNQAYITDNSFPYFIIYRDSFFDEVASNLDFNVFDYFRDREITKALTSSEKCEDNIWVIKARNICNDGSGIIHIPGYDVYISREKAKSLSVYKYINNFNVYLTPNMTYNPRVIENLPNTIPDGSVAVLIPKKRFKLSKSQRLYFSNEEYRRFYSIARNLSTQSINVDRLSIYFYGVLKDE